MVSSSHSTDETIVADSDVEMDSAMFNRTATKSQDAIKIEDDDEEVKDSEDRQDTVDHQEDRKSTDYLSTLSNNMRSLSPKDQSASPMKKVEKDVESHADRHENSDIIFSQDLIVRDITTPIPPPSTPNNVVNFKRFRKVHEFKHYPPQ